MIKVIVRRRIKEGIEVKAEEALKDLRAAALHQPGYVTGETWVDTADPHTVLTISTWASLGHLKAWLENEQRIERADLLRPLLQTEEQISTYHVVGGET